MLAHGNPVAGLRWFLDSKILRISIAKDALRSCTKLTVQLVFGGVA